jgi:CheY-like chemotaxis protein
MPEMNGYEATAEIRRIETLNGRQSAADIRRTPIIALTASAIAGEKEKSMAMGMDDFVTKPIVGHAIDAVLNRWLVLSS